MYDDFGVKAAFIPALLGAHPVRFLCCERNFQRATFINVCVCVDVQIIAVGYIIDCAVGAWLGHDGFQWYFSQDTFCQLMFGK